MNFIERIEELYESGFVERLHTVKTHDRHTVAAHVYGSMIIAVELCGLNGVDYKRILWTLLYHDAPEKDTGDIPAPTKRLLNSAAIEDLENAFYDRLEISPMPHSEIENKIIKASDYLDLGYICLVERRMGNKTKHLDLVHSNIQKYLKEIIGIIGVQPFAHWIEAEYERI